MRLNKIFFGNAYKKLKEKFFNIVLRPLLRLINSFFYYF